MFREISRRINSFQVGKKLILTRSSVMSGVAHRLLDHISLIGIALLAAFAIASCSRPSSGTAEIELNVLMDADVNGDWHAFIDEFEKLNPGVHVNYVEGSSETNAREVLYVTSMLGGQVVYDLIYADVVWVPKF